MGRRHVGGTTGEQPRLSEESWEAACVRARGPARAVNDGRCRCRCRRRCRFRCRQRFRCRCRRRCRCRCRQRFRCRSRRHCRCRCRPRCHCQCPRHCRPRCHCRCRCRQHCFRVSRCSIPSSASAVAVWIDAAEPLRLPSMAPRKAMPARAAIAADRGQDQRIFNRGRAVLGLQKFDALSPPNSTHCRAAVARPVPAAPKVPREVAEASAARTPSSPSPGRNSSVDGAGRRAGGRVVWTAEASAHVVLADCLRASQNSGSDQAEQVEAISAQRTPSAGPRPRPLLKKSETARPRARPAPGPAS